MNTRMLYGHLFLSSSLRKPTLSTVQLNLKKMVNFIMA